MKTKNILTPSYIINRLNEISEWINKNGFGNRGRRHVSEDARELEKALEIVLTASVTLAAWERVYQKFYIEKTVNDYPEFALKYANLWDRIRNGWEKDPEYLYHRAVEYNQHREEAENL